MTDAYLDQTIEKDLFEERKAKLLFERQEAEEVLRNLKNPNASTPDALEKFLELADSASSVYQMAIPAKRRQMVKITTSNLSVDQKEIDFTWQIPFREIALREKSDDGRPSQGLVRTWEEILASFAEHLPASFASFLKGESRLI